MLLDMSKAKIMLSPKKSLGQNFLKSSKIAEEIVSAGEVGSEDVVLEVGPGKGILTEELLKKAKKVIAVEKDERLAAFLQEKFAEDIKNGKLEIAKGDILHFQPTTLPHRQAGYNLQPTTYKIIANIPYYITSRFLRTFLEGQPEGLQPALMVLMIQKEVAERIVGQKESLLSISVKAYGKPEIVRKVPAGFFSPPPKVDSAILKISGISKDFFRDIDEKLFFETVKKGFAQKRKMLINNLGMKQADFEACGIPAKARAEELRLEDWKCLAEKLFGNENSC